MQVTLVSNFPINKQVPLYHHSSVAVQASSCSNICNVVYTTDQQDKPGQCLDVAIHWTELFSFLNDSLC